MKKLFLVLALVAMVALVGCTQGSANVNPNGPQLVDEDPSTPAIDVSMDAIQGGFEPSQIVAKKGVPLRLSITGKSIAPDFNAHGFAIKELDISERIPMGETVVVEFTPDTAGDFVFFCNVFCGQGHIGQAGILHVIE